MTVKAGKNSNVITGDNNIASIDNRTSIYDVNGSDWLAMRRDVLVHQGMDEKDIEDLKKTTVKQAELNASIMDVLEKFYVTRMEPDFDSKLNGLGNRLDNRLDEVKKDLEEVKKDLDKGFKIVAAVILGISIFFYVNMSKFHPKEVQEVTVSTLEQKALNE